MGLFSGTCQARQQKVLRLQGVAEKVLPKDPPLGLTHDFGPRATHPTFSASKPKTLLSFIIRG
ncbi:MAG: hypothetical protein AVDCRST_MAG22-3224 [uncultured Rubrobacteraceae bacterium]|uniref:Uncharacterized protein n=1 Tax=uncultured Rubrobacteraceae bacterium TaxID=349277 RepID=A0A6J4Q164_9ACTN|nr:MAG: hypothetical protein AVDCRST_MAG22-3224 [uncultured Rubrobacteraceae bacterium]